MKVIGITGGVGSGKSAVLTYLNTKYGAVICQLDDVAKKLQKKGTRCYQNIIEVFGEQILDPSGELDRKALGKIVFQNEEQLQKLNAIVHPEVKRAVQQEIADREEESIPLFVIEAALLPTAGYETICDEMWYVYTEESVRRERLKCSRGYTEEEITDMMRSQPEETVFRQFCDVVLDNSGSFEDTKKQIGELLI